MLLQEIKLIQNKNNLFILNQNRILQNDFFFSKNRFFVLVLIFPYIHKDTKLGTCKHI